MYPILLYLITPNLGLLRNFIKYKEFNWKVYIRTPVVYFILHVFMYLTRANNIVYKSLIFERWYWFIYKSIKSHINNDYHRKKNKHAIKKSLSQGELNKLRRSLSLTDDKLNS